MRTSLPNSSIQRINRPAGIAVDEIVSEAESILFVKSCGGRFSAGSLSRLALKIIKRYGVDAKIIDVTSSPKLIPAIQARSGWQYFPQLFVCGEFIGGTLVLDEFFRSGEYHRILRAHGVGGEIPNLRMVEPVVPSAYRPIWRMAMSPNGDMVGAALASGAIVLYCAQTGRFKARLDGVSPGWVNSLVFTPDGGSIVAGGSDTRLTIMNIRSGRRLECFSAHERWVNDLAISSDGRTLVSVSADKTITFWRLADWEHQSRHSGHRDVLWSVSTTGDGRSFVVGDAGGEVSLWDSATLTCLTRIRAHKNCVTDIVADRETGGFCTVSYDGTARVWNTRCELIYTHHEHTSRIWAVEQLDDGSYLTSSADGTVQRWSYRSPKTRWKATFDSIPIAIAALSHDKGVLVGHLDGTASLVRDFNLVEACSA